MRRWSDVRLLWIVLAAGALLRVVLAFMVLPGRGFAGDLDLFARWSLVLAARGPGSIYGLDATANYPPLYLLVLWGVGAAARLVAAASGADLASVALVLVKVPAVLADVACGWLLYAAGRRWWTPRVGLVAAALYLFGPVAWYDSAVWGQVDSVGALPVLACLVLLAARRPAPAVACAVAALLVKPQAVVVLAVLLPVLARRHLLDRREPAVLLRCAGAAAAVLAVCLPFDLERFAAPGVARVPVVADLAGLWGLYRSVGGTFAVLTANAYILWALAGPQPLVAQIGSPPGRWTPDAVPVDVPLLGQVQAVTVGAALLAVAAALVALPLLLVRGLEASPAALMSAHVVLAAAFFALPTRVHERYLFPVYLTGALLAATAVVRVAGYLAASLATTVNLHAVLAGVLSVGPPWATPWSGLGDWSRSEPVAVTVSLAHTAVLAAALAGWSLRVTTGPPRSAPGGS